MYEQRLADFQALALCNLSLLDTYEAAMPELLQCAHYDGEDLQYGVMRTIDRMEALLEEGRQKQRAIREERDHIEKRYRTL